MSHRQRDEDAAPLAHAHLDESDGSSATGWFTRSPSESTELRRFRNVDDRACLEAAVRLAAELDEEREPERLGYAFVETLRALLPGRRLSLRLLDGSGHGRLGFAYATGPLLRGSRDEVRISERGLALLGRPRATADAAGVRVAAAYECDFEEGAVGFDVPVVDGERLVGVVGVEYPPLSAPGGGDAWAVAQLALTFGGALGRARLRREATYLRGYLGKLLDHAEVPILVLGKGREIRVASQGLLRILDAQRHALLGADFLTIVPEVDRRRLLPVFAAALRGEPLTDFEVHVGRDDRIAARLSISVSSLLDADGEIEGVMVIGRDLTALRQLEDQVVQTEKLATLGQLAAGVVHELNNPLTSIAAYAEQLHRVGEREGRDDAELARIGRILEAAERIQRFTRDLMIYARPSTGERTPVRIGTILERSVGFCEHVITRAGAKLVRDEAPDLPVIHGVEGQLHQVFINLLTNACHAVPASGGVVTLTTRARPEGGVLVRVGDNGPGVPESLRQSVFEPFFSTKRAGEGTGLGLPIVKSIVERHGGEIRLETSEGGGAAFVVELPIQGDVPPSSPPDP